jgi:hypothetical protein
MDKSSGRNDLNSGSDSAGRFGSTASEAYKGTASTNNAEKVTGRLSNGYVGNGMRAPNDPKSIVKP